MHFNGNQKALKCFKYVNPKNPSLVLKSIDIKQYFDLILCSCVSYLWDFFYGCPHFCWQEIPFDIYPPKKL